MLKQFDNLSSWREDNITVQPHETYRHYFSDTSPNMMIIVNPNSAVIKIGIGSVPTDKKYEFKVEYNTTEVVGRPIGTKYLYLYNDSSVKANLKVFSINKEFDISALKNMNVALSDLSIETSNIIGGFEDGVSLPSGDNKIGNVGLYGDALTALLAIDGYSKTTSEKSSNINTYMSIVNDNLVALKNNLIKNSSVTGFTNLYDVVKAIQNLDTGATGISNMLTKNSLGMHVISETKVSNNIIPLNFKGYININELCDSDKFIFIDLNNSVTYNTFCKINPVINNGLCEVIAIAPAFHEEYSTTFSVVTTPNGNYLNMGEVTAWHKKKYPFDDSYYSGKVYVGTDYPTNDTTLLASVSMYSSVLFHELFKYSGNLSGMHREIKAPLLSINKEIGKGGTTVTTIMSPENKESNPVKCADAIKTIKCRGEIPVIVQLYYTFSDYLEYTLYPEQELNDLQFEIFKVSVKIANNELEGKSNIIVLGGFYD